VTAVSFDLGGTLISASPSVGTIYAEVCRRHGVEVSPETCDRAFEAAWARRSAGSPAGRDRFSAAPEGEEGWWRGVILDVLAACGIPAERAPAVAAFRDAFADPSAWRVFDDVHATLASLKQAGYRLAILSNWDSRMPALLSKLGLLPYFDVVLCSALEGIEKPNPELFRTLVSRLGSPPAGTLHVGDLVVEDYRAARASGLRALWLDRGRSGQAGADVDPSHVVTSIGGVARALAGWRAACPPDSPAERP